jgi:hypothetical protein
MNCSLSGTEPGLVAYWKLDGNLLDSTPHALNGTLLGTATYVGASVATTPCVTTDVPPLPMPVNLVLTGTPNPPRNLIELAFVIPSQRSVSLAVFDPTGREVAALLDHVTMAAGPHRATLNTGSLRTGLYLARLQAEQSGHVQDHHPQIGLPSQHDPPRDRTVCLARTCAVSANGTSPAAGPPGNE